MDKQPIEVGNLVKVRITDGLYVERIWAKVLDKDVEKQEITIELNNYPVSPCFKFGEVMTIPVSYVLELHQDN